VLAITGCIDEGGKLAESACVRQSGQSSPCKACSVEGEPAARPISTFTSFTPWTVQISVQTVAVGFASANACETDGMSDAMKIAVQAIHAVNTRVRRPIFMAEILA
jgi:hypothetical protein